MTINNSGLSDNGTRKVYSTGAKKEELQVEKGRYDLIPAVSLKRLAVHFARGAVKYGDRNFEKGIPFSRMFDSLKRHIDQWALGHRDEDHLAAVAWNAFVLMFGEWMVEKGLWPAELNDLPKYKKEE